jgi:hypothetical protein
MATWFSAPFSAGYHYWYPANSHRIEPGENDVILGRGGDNWKWPGNQKLQRMALEKIGEYMNARKKGKGQLAEKLVEQVHQQGGRFLRQNTAGGPWEEVDFETARAKARDCIKSVEVDPNKLLKRNRIQTFSVDGPFVEIADDDSPLGAWTEEDEERGATETALMNGESSMHLSTDNNVVEQLHLDSQDLSELDSMDDDMMQM